MFSNVLCVCGKYISKGDHSHHNVLVFLQIGGDIGMMFLLFLHKKYAVATP